MTTVANTSPRKPRRRLRTVEKLFILLVVLGVGAALLRMLYRPAQPDIHSTESTIQELKMAVTEYKVATGQFPRSLEALVGEPRNYLKEGKVPTDAWGNQFTYMIKDDIVIIRSAGPDRAIDTEDDVEND